jgi:hypothetical protein
MDRHHCFNYFVLVCSLWKVETLERHLPLLKQALKAGVNDADQGSRKSARYMYWVMACRPQWKSAMEIFLSDLEAAQQKHIKTESIKLM